MKQGIQHGRLPIGDYIKMASRHVLTVNQVLEIMLRWLVSRDWEKAFMEVIPKRKLPEIQERKEIEDKEREDDQSIASQDHQDSENDEDEVGPDDVSEDDGQLESTVYEHTPGPK